MRSICWLYNDPITKEPPTMPEAHSLPVTLDEVFLTIRGERQYLWRAVDQDGNVLDMRVAESSQ